MVSVLQILFVVLMCFRFCNSEEELEDHFCKFGEVSQVHIVIDKDTKRSKGIAYIHFAVAESAVRLIVFLLLSLSTLAVLAMSFGSQGPL